MPQVTASCGHAVPFDDNPSDPYRAAKRAKLEGRACPACRKAAVAERERADQAAAAERKHGAAAGVAVGLSGNVLKSKALGLLPDGAELTLRRAGGRWSGTVALGGRVHTAEAAGLMSVLQKLAVAALKGGGPADPPPASPTNRS